MSVLHGDRHACITAFADGLYERNLSEERYLQFLSQLFAAVLAKDIILIIWQLGGCEPRHILNQAQYGYIDFVVEEHIHSFACVDQRHRLWGGDHDSACEVEVLNEGEMDITGAWWEVDNEIVEFAPSSILNELFDGIAGHASTPYDRLVGVNKEADG